MRSLEEIQEIIKKEFDKKPFSQKPDGLYQAIEYLISNGGKRIRPSIVLMSANMFTQEIEKAIDAALALEIFHNFTLMHDDIMDNSAVRRGQPTVHKKWDENTAILSGDAMAIIAYQYLAKYTEFNYKLLIDIFNKMALEVCEGQQYDMDFESRNDVSEAEYLDMIEKKTSVLIAACMQMGGIIGGAPEKDATLLYEFGKNIGLAFQLQDDLLDSFGNIEIFGKKIGGDIKANKKTFLLIKALELAENEEKKALNALLENKDIDAKDKIEKVLEIYSTLDIENQTQKRIAEYYQLAKKNLAMVNVNNDKKQIMIEFAENLMVRVK